MDINALTVLNYIRNPFYAVHLERVKNAVYRDVAVLDAQIAVTKEPVPYEERNSLVYKPIKEGSRWGELFDCSWFHLTGHVDANVVQNKKDYVAILNLGGEACVFNDDGPVQGLTNVMGVADYMQTQKGKRIVSLDLLDVTENGKVEIWAEGGNNGVGYRDCGGVRFAKARIAKVNKQLFDYYYDFLSLWQFSYVCEDQQKKKELNAALRSAYLLADGLNESGVRKARGVLSKFFADHNSDFTVYAVGHAHLDLGWLWPIRETKRKAERTFSNALVNIESYSDYVFGASQPQQYEWMKERRPKLYARIKKAVQDGRIEPQGCMWCEPDTNLPCGESLIRQCFYGKKFFMDEFGKDIDTLWVPDVFGYSGALPQILRGCGADKFMTIKLSWNTVNKFPYHSFRWRGIDGSEVLVHMPPEGDYNSTVSPFAVKKAQDAYREKAVSKQSLMLFGIGDGGGGPGEYHVNMVERCAKIDGLPNVKQTPASEFFKALEKERENLPAYSGELYLEKHRGTYTTQSREKRYNRKAENSLMSAQWLCAVGSLQGKPYPSKDFERLWKEVLLYQFHDILPGSSIGRVYKECSQRFEIILSELDKMRNDVVKSGTDNLCVVNPSPFAQTGYVRKDGKLYGYDVKGYSSAPLCEAEQIEACEGLVATDNVLSNDILTAMFNDNGEVISLKDSRADGYDCVKDTFNTLRVYTDKRLYPYNAWDIDPKYEKRKSRKMTLVYSKSYVKDGAAVREQKFVYGKSLVEQTVILEKGKDMLVFRNKADWHETHKMLRADFFPKDFADTVKCDIQFGHIERSTKTDDKVTAAQFEIAAHKWVDVYKDGHGVALINDCKYGHRVKNGKISLNLLRSPVYPDPDADRGEHSFDYAIYPHVAKTEDCGVVQRAYNFNRPVQVFEKQIDLPEFSASCENAVIDNIHMTEDGKIALRIYESANRQCEFSLNTSLYVKNAYQSDLIYKNRKSVDIAKLTLRPFEIITVLLEI